MEKMNATVFFLTLSLQTKSFKLVVVSSIFGNQSFGFISYLDFFCTALRMNYVLAETNIIAI